MSSFVDEVRFEVQSGDGGGGAVSFRREKYVPRGGPDGGDGGDGGNVAFVTRRNLATLSHLKGKPLLRAPHGSPGRFRRMHGKNGEDVLIPIPPGTIIRDSATGNILHDFSNNVEGEQWVCLQGGKGGKGNWHFRTSRNQAPTHARQGLPGERRNLHLELALIADIGLIGMPDAGKSSLINAITAARSKVGNYPFTTKIPHLGVLKKGNHEIVIADIPGLIKGAAEGAGLGHKFLRHVGRTASLAYLVDLGGEHPPADVELLNHELESYNPDLLKRKRIIIGTKTDLDENGEKLEELRNVFPDNTVLGVSVYSRRGLDILINKIIEEGAAEG